jgi:hypothetical protein
VASGASIPPFTVTDTDIARVVKMLGAEGVAATAGVTLATDTELIPVALVYVDELALSGVYVAVSVSVPPASDPAGIEMPAPPPFRAVAAEV